MESVAVNPIETAIFPFNLSTKERINGYAVEEVGCFLIEEMPYTLLNLMVHYWCS
jgi:hypothetical protein